QVVHHEVAVAVDRIEPAAAEARTGRVRDQRRAGAAGDAIREVPVDQPDAELERAAPVRALEVRALLDPAVEQRLDALEISDVAGEPPRLSQPDDLEMAIQLPEVLRVADDPRVTVVERLAEAERRGGAGQRIDVPCRRKAELEAAAEELVAAGQHVLRGADHAARGLGRRGD